MAVAFGAPIPPTVNPAINGLVGAAPQSVFPGNPPNPGPGSVGTDGGYVPSSGGTGASTFNFGTITSPFTTPPVAGPPRPTVPGFTPPPNVGPMTGLANVNPLSETDLAAKQGADYGQAKEKVGLEARGAATAMQGALSGRGVLGSGVEGRGLTNIMGQGQQQMGAVNAAQADELAKMQEDVAAKNFQGNIDQRGQTNTRDIANYEGDVNQRGQTIGADEANLSAGVGQRGQDVTESGNILDNRTRLATSALGMVGQFASGAAGSGGAGSGSFGGGGGGGGREITSIADYMAGGMTGREATLAHQRDVDASVTTGTTASNTAYQRYLADRGYVSPGQQFGQNTITGLINALGLGGGGQQPQQPQPYQPRFG